MKRQILYALGVTFGVIFFLGFVKYLQISRAIAEQANRPQPAEAVTSYITDVQEWPQELAAVGTLSSTQGTVLRAEEAGRVVSITFDSGTNVSQGTVLVSLDTSVEEAQLDGAKAQLKLAELNVDRQRSLRKRNANAQSDLDSAEATYQFAKAEVSRLEAVIRRKQIIAPFDGIAGIRQVNIGQMVAQGDKIVAFHSLKDLYVDFSLPQQVVDGLAQGYEVHVVLHDDKTQKYQATLTGIDSQVDENTRNINLRATLSRVYESLRPGMFVDVSVVLPKKDRVVALPSTSVQYAPYGNSVYVIEAGENVEGPRPIKNTTVVLGRHFGDLVEVISGLKQGEEVVSSGTFKLRPGISVVVRNSVQPEQELTPTPADS
ncbi:MAG: efflux RND transporter periplasmic adaptor subunit [Bdellovibrionales bacterium]|nr:efflux RND transporter periplasmic adaptor subunit [Bdellovibrionales bacterium]